MESLRWVLLGLGALLIVGVYLWGRGLLRVPEWRSRERRRGRERVEPTAGRAGADFAAPADAATAGHGSAYTAGAADESSGGLAEADAKPAAARHQPVAGGDEGAAADGGAEPPDAERVVTIRLVPKGPKPWSGQDVVLALRAAGLQHGRYGIFHRLPEEGAREPLFSVANLTEPGSFDLTNLATTTLSGMSFFLILPGVGDPVARFDTMVDTARSLALELDGELHDDRGSSWSIQRERYVREQIIDYRYHLERS